MSKSCVVRPDVPELFIEPEIVGAPLWVWKLSLAAGPGVHRGELRLAVQSCSWKTGSPWVRAHAFSWLAQIKLPNCVPGEAESSSGVSWHFQNAFQNLRHPHFPFPSEANTVSAEKLERFFLNLDCFIWQLLLIWRTSQDAISLIVHSFYRFLGNIPNV